MSGKDWAVTVAVGLCAIGLLACGGGGSGSSGSGSGSGGAGGDEAAFEESRLKLAECLREHGIDAPDPVPGEKGMALQKSSKDGGGIDPEDPATQKAFESCEDEVGFEPPEVSAEQEEEMQEAMLSFAQCMREHGVDMPDPEFSGGKAKMQIGGPGGPGNMDQPATEAAQEACQDKMPGGPAGFKAGP